MNQELYYTADNKLMAVEVSLGAEMKYCTPKELFAMSDRGGDRRRGLRHDARRAAVSVNYERGRD